MGNPKDKLTLYMPPEMITEIQAQADRHERSLSWMVMMAWRIAKQRMGEWPGVDDLIGRGFWVGLEREGIDEHTGDAPPNTKGEKKCP